MTTFNELNIDKCMPYNDFVKKALFVDDKNVKLYSPERAKKLGIKPYNIDESKLTDEARDWIDEFPVVVLKKGAYLVHQVDYKKVFVINKKDMKIDKLSMCWWEKYYPGQSSYGGGWFTYKTDYGGPQFGLGLKYKLHEDVAILFIPNKYKSALHCEKQVYEKNKDFSLYFDLKKQDELKARLETRRMLLKQLKSSKNKNDKLEIKKKMSSLNTSADLLLDYEFDFAGSHLIEGVKDWKNKGYKPITHPLDSYADELSKRLATLGINGYISCDENEVFLSHDIMKKSIKHPKELYFTKEVHQEKKEEIIKFLINYCSPQRATLTVTTSTNRSEKEIVTVKINNPDDLKIKGFLHL